MLLKDLPIGSKGRILGFKSADSDFRRRLVTLGAMPGTSFDVVRCAPLGDPLQIRVRGASISLRRNEADILEVERCE